ncbi:hypothetical protein EC973_006930, partial [Apophysomyces ossiformis]
NVSMTNEQRDHIYIKKQEIPKMTLTELATWARRAFQLEKEPDITTISRILKRKREGSPEPTRK